MYAFCSSLTKRSSSKSVQTRFVAPQNPSIDTYLVIKVIISCDNFIAKDRMKKFGARLIFLILNDKISPATREMPVWKPGLREKLLRT